MSGTISGVAPAVSQGGVAMPTHPALTRPKRRISRSGGGGGATAKIASPVYRFQALRMASLLYPTGATITSSSGELGYPAKQEELGGGSIGG